MTTETAAIVGNTSVEFTAALASHFRGERIEFDLLHPEAGKTREYKLALIGVRLHVLADTFSHAGFAGTTSSINMQDQTHILVEPANASRPETRILWRVGNHSPLKSVATGHAQMGSLPDMPGARYSYLSPKIAARVHKDNPTTYKYATLEVKKFLETMRTAGHFPEDNSHSVERFKTLLGAIVGTGESAPVYLREAVFQFPYADERSTGFALRYPSSWGTSNSNNMWEFTLAQADESLEKRCKYLFDEVTKIDGPASHWSDVCDMRKIEGHEKASEFTTKENSYPLLKKSSKKANTEYSIIRRVRVKYWEGGEESKYRRLKAVDFAARWHHDWFKQKYGNLAESAMEALSAEVHVPVAFERAIQADVPVEAAAVARQ